MIVFVTIIVQFLKLSDQNGCLLDRSQAYSDGSDSASNVMTERSFMVEEYVLPRFEVRATLFQLLTMCTWLLRRVQKCAFPYSTQRCPVSDE